MTKPEDAGDMPEQEAQPEQPQQAEVEQATEAPEATAQQPVEQQLAELEAALESARAEADKQKDTALRAAAETDNVRRRAAQEVEKARSFALEKFAGELLSVVDNLERALQAIDANDETMNSVREGIEMTHRGFLSSLQKFGIEKVDPQGEAFNPEHHEAMGMQENDEVAANTVLAVMQKGYLLNGRLLRPAMVMVSRQSGGGVNTTA